MARFLLFTCVFFSGCAGLLYEVVWHRYLGILLGAQARATAIVLAIFLGGISTGYLVFGRWTRWKKWNLFRTYAYVEIGMGLWASAFPFLFRGAQALTASLYGLLGVESLLIDIFISILLIGFPTFLMGGTLPLLTQGLSEDLKSASRTHALIYGVNTVGACIGSALTGYLLIPWVGLNVTLWVGAMFNLVIGLVAAVYFTRRFVDGRKIDDDLAPLRWFDFNWNINREQGGIFTIGFLSGFTLIALQAIIIRLVGLSTGSSNYNFTLIVTIFIFSLGLSSLLARSIGEYSAKHLFRNQFGVMAGLLALYFTADQWPYWGHLLRVLIRDLPEAFYPYQFLLGLGFLSLLIVPIGLAGFTLPLCFHLLKDDAETLGQRVGQLYGLNTLGCVLGALLGGFWLLNFFNLDQLFKMCVMLTIASCFVSLWLYARQAELGLGRVLAQASLGLGALVAIILAPQFPKERFTQPFRQPQPIANVTFQGADAFAKHISRSTKYVLYKDGPNTSVGIGASFNDGQEVSRTIFVNGKSDGNTRGDYFTTVMLAHLPALFAEKNERVAVIGFGTGSTAGTFTLYDEVKRIDVVDISGTILQNSGEFDKYNHAVSKNPKAHFHEMDAFRYLEGTKQQFDIIVSEPSNPWVAGIENLYSREFYSIVRKKLSGEGAFVQWIHTYSFNDELLRMVMATIQTEFPFVSVYQLRGGDIALVGLNRPWDRADLLRGIRRWSANPKIAADVKEGGVTRFETLAALEVVPPSLAKEIAKDAEIHTLDRPMLSNGAAQAFFAGTSAKVDSLRRRQDGYYASVKDSLLYDLLNGHLASRNVLDDFRYTFCEHHSSKTGYLCEEVVAAMKILDPKYQPASHLESVPNNRDLASISLLTTKERKKFDAQSLVRTYEMFEAFRKYYSPIAFLPQAEVFDRLNACIKETPPSQELYGECLLQKILALQTLYLRGPEFKEDAVTYVNWFDKLPATFPNYDKLRQANEILQKVLAQTP